MNAKLSIASVGLVLFGCGGGDLRPAKMGGTEGPETHPGKATLPAETVTEFNAALASFVAHDKANDWNEAICNDVARRFDGAAALPEAAFNAGLVLQRCGKDGEAKGRFEKALRESPQFHHARAQLALYEYKESGNEDAAIASLQQAVLDAKFQNVPALVNLAMMQMQRDSAQSGDGCHDDMECAKKNLQRALAIDDGLTPAQNQLALYYFKQAKKRAGVIDSGKRQIATNAALGKRANVQELELAALVCSQAIRKNPGYAPIHNTAGLIQNELGLVNGAVAEFKQAATLDPRLF
jgi:tetratricopeptide (TPR) repeat protein